MRRVGRSRRAGGVLPLSARPNCAGWRPTATPRHARVAVMAALAEVFAERACRGPGGQVVDPLSVLPALFAILWRGRLAYLDNRVLDSGSTVWASRGGRADDPASGAASGDMLRLGGETHTMAGLESATVRPADVTGTVTEAFAAGLSPIAASSSSPQPGGEAARW